MFREKEKERTTQRSILESREKGEYKENTSDILRALAVTKPQTRKKNTHSNTQPLIENVCTQIKERAVCM